METFRTIQGVLRPNDWVISLYPKYAYFRGEFLVPPRFWFQGKHYQFNQDMPFGLALHPESSQSSDMVVIDRYPRSQQVHVFMHLNDWLIKKKSKPEVLLQQKDISVDSCSKTWSIDKLKKILVNTIWGNTHYLGAYFNLAQGKVYPSEERFQNLLI